MYVLVVGGGKVGHYLSRGLLEEGYEVLVLERDPKVCRDLTDDLGSVVMQGDGCEVATLVQAGAARADAIIAATGDDEDNLIVCQVVKLKFKVPRTIALINDPKNESVFRQLGIDETVSSTKVILERIQVEMPSHPLLHLLALRQYGLEVVELKVQADAPVVGKRLRELPLPAESVILLIFNKTNGAVVPTSETQLEAEDDVIAVTRSESEDLIRAIFTEQ